MEKSNKKYKAAADKKRGEKLFKEEDMMMVYLRREKILVERVPTEQPYPDWNSRTSSFEERGTDVRRKPRQQVNFESQLSTIQISCRQTELSCQQPTSVVDRLSLDAFSRELKLYSLSTWVILLSTCLLHVSISDFV